MIITESVSHYVVEKQESQHRQAPLLQEPRFGVAPQLFRKFYFLHHLYVFMFRLSYFRDAHKS